MFKQHNVLQGLDQRGVLNVLLNLGVIQSSNPVGLMTDIKLPATGSIIFFFIQKLSLLMHDK